MKGNLVLLKNSRKFFFFSLINSSLQEPLQYTRIMWDSQGTEKIGSP